MPRDGDMYWIQEIVVGGAEWWAGPTALPDPIPELVGPTLSAEPNPANPRVTLRLVLAVAGPVRVAVHDVMGRRVALLVDAPLAAGEHRLVWNGDRDDGRIVPSGVYLVSVESPEGVAVRRVVIAR